MIFLGPPVTQQHSNDTTNGNVHSLRSRSIMGHYQIAVRFGLAHKTRMKCHKSHFICFHHNLNIIGSYYLNVARLNALYSLCDGNF